ncbi:MAG: methyltransferase domain-containing protein [Bifidobacteriaceae bacterium]|jgi:SAM-dependent methyltransferase|nr:methyltransferase domain-containing protein [Bifidobacteriaceae bacterium]
MSQYIHGHGEAVAKAHASRNVANSAAHLAPHLRPGLRLLDIGSAGGALTRDLAAHVAPGRVVGVDAAADAVRAAQDDPSRPGNLEYQAADAYALPFGDGEFDVVHIHQVLHHLEDPPRALREAARVAGPGGLLSLREGDYGAAWWFPAATAWESWQEAFQLVSRAGGMEVDAGRRLLHWLGQAGLAAPGRESADGNQGGGWTDGIGQADGPKHAEIHVSGSVWTYPGFAPAQEIAGSWADRITDRRFADLAEQAGVADLTSLTATAKGLVEWARHPDAFFAMPHVEALVRLPA